MFFRRNHSVFASRIGVCDDWIRALPRDKGSVFKAVVQSWECSYAMMSVALDDALSLRASGQLVCACEQVHVSVDLFTRLSRGLASFCEIAARRGRRIATVPSVEPMRAEFFRGDTAQSAASWNNILHHVLFVSRLRFLHKVRILSRTIVELEAQFAAAGSEVAGGVAGHPCDAWNMLDCVHYDFSTCLRETEIVLKSFLRALPADHLELFADELDVLVPQGSGQPLTPAVSSPASA